VAFSPSNNKRKFNYNYSQEAGKSRREKKSRNKEQGQKIENCNKYGWILTYF
jgi:hypothetical protein